MSAFVLPGSFHFTKLTVDASNWSSHYVAFIMYDAKPHTGGARKVKQVQDYSLHVQRNHMMPIVIFKLWRSADMHLLP